MKILVVNTGSSSIKYQLFDMSDQSVLITGLLERIGAGNGRLIHRVENGGRSPQPLIQEGLRLDHRRGVALIAGLLHDPRHGVLEWGTNPAAIGHRVVHGGEEFHHPVRIDDNVLAAIRRNISLAPLHNPANLTGIEQTLALFPDTPQVAVFDTAFHQTLPAKAFRYALPAALYAKHHIRRYGFHGTSHLYVAKAAAQHLNTPLEQLNLITIHLGNGASMTAIEQGQSVETSMGMTPVEGLIMGSRCGDVDPAILILLADRFQMSSREIDQLLNRQSGVKGVCGSHDMRDILEKKSEGDAAAELAVEMYCHRLKKYIGAYYAVLGQVDALSYTGGIGENAAAIRELACAGLDRLGIRIDPGKNQAPISGLREIHQEGSPVSILVIPTNEELEIARQAMAVLSIPY
jgi:acetate kinase